MSKPKIVCLKCGKPALGKRQYKDGSALFIHEQKTLKTPLGQASEITKYCEVKKS